MLSNTIVLDLTPDLRVLAFTGGVGTLTGLLFGLGPMLSLRGSTRSGSRLEPIDAARPAGRGVVNGQNRFGPAKLLVVTQVALSLVMVTAAGLLLGSWFRQLAIDPGFERERVLIGTINPVAARVPPDARAALNSQILERLRTIPAVGVASAAWITPLTTNSRVTLDADPSTGGTTSPAEVRLNQVTPNYFRALGTKFLAGRDFSESDVPQSPWVAVVNEELAKRTYGSADVVGRRLRIHRNDGVPEPITIIGVVANTTWRSLRESPEPIIYYGLTQMAAPQGGLSFVLRTETHPAELNAAVKAAVTEVNPRLSVALSTLEERVNGSLRLPRTLATLAASFGALTLLLSLIGLYGVMSYSIGRRRNEIGIRLALGAARSAVLRMVFRESAGIVVPGVVLGLGLGVLTTKLIASFLYGVAPTDPMTMASAVLMLMAVAFVAAGLPARRAALMNPVDALRQD
jgi:predicted permease